MMIVPMSLQAQKDVKSFVEQYKKKEGFTVITIGKPIMSMVGVFAKFGKDKETAEIVKRVSTIQVVDGWCKNFFNETVTFCSANQYEELIEIVEHDEIMKIFGKIEGEAITGLIVLSHSHLDNSVDMVSLTGKFTFDDIQSITGNKGKISAGFII